ncbi:MAG: hypothetical protein PHF99_12540 [Bacteroidales bacterium]|nr:hypothetical protein [Bacteroidales bacterium]MDD4236833.1 hypothetical protein [Bacteroidales bacterium]
MFKVFIEEFVPMLNSISIENEEDKVFIEFNDDSSSLFELRNWLEAISSGVQQTSFVFHNEYTPMVFDFMKSEEKRGVLTISEFGDENTCYLKVDLTRYRVVKSFYIAVLNYWNDYKFSDGVHKSCQLGTLIARQLGVSKNLLIKKLVKMTKSELIEFIRKSIVKDSPCNTDTQDHNFRVLNIIKEINDYDKLNSTEKHKHISKLLVKRVKYYYYRDMEAFKSSRIEKFVRQHKL